MLSLGSSADVQRKSQKKNIKDTNRKLSRGVPRPPPPTAVRCGRGCRVTSHTTTHLVGREAGSCWKVDQPVRRRCAPWWPKFPLGFTCTPICRENVPGKFSGGSPFTVISPGGLWVMSDLSCSRSHSCRFLLPLVSRLCSIETPDPRSGKVTECSSSPSWNQVCRTHAGLTRAGKHLGGRSDAAPARQRQGSKVTPLGPGRIPPGAPREVEFQRQIRPAGCRCWSSASSRGSSGGKVQPSECWDAPRLWAVIPKSDDPGVARMIVRLRRPDD